MANPAYGYHDKALAKPTPSVLTKHAKRVAAAKAERDAYKEVDARDGGKSRLSGRTTSPGAVDPRTRREHHHLLFRSTHPELAHEPRNIILVTAEEHQLIHAGALQIEGTDATKRIVGHWNRDMVPVGKEPFLLLSKRRSQRKEIA